MNQQQALRFISDRLHPVDDPTLDPDTVVSLLEHARAVDDNDRPPSDDNWTPTYSITGCYRAIAEGWAMKRDKIAGRYDFTTDGQMFRRSQMVDHCENARKRWQARVQSSPSTLGASS
jgi:hypothetical protein